MEKKMETGSLTEKTKASIKVSTLKEHKGIPHKRYFTTKGTHPFDQIEWELRDAIISNEKGEVVFAQKNVEIPRSWSMLATNVVVSKYFRGALGTPQRENSVKQLITRVAGTIANWARQAKYFRSEQDAQAFEDDLTYLLVQQKMAFNSPVWFNVG